jgi:hypothetical protein
VIGMAPLPGARNVDEFWRNREVESISFFPTRIVGWPDALACAIRASPRRAGAGRHRGFDAAVQL